MKHGPKPYAVLAAAVVLAVLAGTARGAARKPHDVERFHSRPDLAPPVVTVTARARDRAPGYLFFAPKQLEAGAPGSYDLIQQGPEIIDDRGQVVWFGPIPGSRTKPRDARPHATDFRAQTYRGRPVLTWWQGRSFFGVGDGTYMIYDSSYRRVAEVKPQHGVQGDEHEFTITPRGTALITFYERAPHEDLSSAGGAKDGTLLESGIQEIDIATGRVVFEWHSRGHVAVSETYAKAPKDGDQPFDYFHVNSAAVEPDGDFLVSARNTHALYEISRRTGAILWRLGGKQSDFRLGSAARFAWQHDARRQPDGTITVFDNGAAPPVEKFSRVLTLRVDTKTKTVTLVRALAHPKKLLSGSQGSAQRLPDGHTLVGWGANPYVTEFDASGRVVFDAHWSAVRSDSYRAYRLPWVGHPLDTPAVAARGRGQVTVWVSWNGATEVRRWQLLAGPDAGRLRAVATVAKDGFETAIRARVTGGLLAVRALDASGRTLGTSRLLRRGGSAWRRA